MLMKGKLHEQMSPHDFTPGDFQEGAFNTGQRWKAKLRSQHLKGTLTDFELKGVVTPKYLIKDSLVGDLLDEPWDSLGIWTKEGSGISEIDAGQLHQLPSTTYVGRWQTLVGGLPDTFTVETRSKYDALGMYHNYVFYNGVFGIIIEIWANKIGCVKKGAGYNYFSLNTEQDVWYIWRFVIDGPGDSVKVYRNLVFIREFTGLYPYSLFDGTVHTIAQSSITEIHEDYLKIASGIHIPVTSHLKSSISSQYLKGRLNEK